MASVAQGPVRRQAAVDIIGIGAVHRRVDHRGRRVAEARGNSTFRVPVLAAAIGIYLPLELMVPIFLGGLLALHRREAPRRMGRTNRCATACIAPACCSRPA
jgi:uncharacterized oligopeptide transporter (OPT) family protein